MPEPTSAVDRPPSESAFRWICLAIAMLALFGLGWMLNELRANLKRTADTLNNDLPRILANTKASTETLKLLAEDLKNLRNLAGVSSGSRDRSLVTYADSVLDLIERQQARIGKEKLFGKSLANPMPANEWAVGARREALYQSFRARSRRQMLERLSKTLTGKTWYIQFEDAKPIPLLDWLLENHPESLDLKPKNAGIDKKPAKPPLKSPSKTKT